MRKERREKPNALYNIIKALLELFLFMIKSPYYLFKWIIYLRKQIRYNKFSINRKTSDEDLKQLIKDIKEINLQPVRDEEDFEKQLFQWLTAKGYFVERQVIKGNNKKIDMVVNSKIAIELKIAERSKNIQDLIGQVTIYKQYFNIVLVVILDFDKVEDLREYINLIENVDKTKIFTLILKGELRKIRNKEYILIRKT